LIHPAECRATAVTAAGRAHTTISDTVTTRRFDVSRANLPSSRTLSGTCLGWPESIASTLSEIALSRAKGVTADLSKVALSRPRGGARTLSDITEPLLSLRRGRPRAEIAPRTVELIRYIPVVVGDSTTVSRIVHPIVAVAHIHAIEVVPADEIVVDDDVVTSPTASPTPTAPAAAPNRADRQAHAKRYCGGRRWIVDGRIAWNLIG
jgi:hypothetical protein